MEHTRVDSAVLATALAKSARWMDDLEGSLKSLLVVMSDEERAHLLRTPVRFPTAAVKLLAAAEARPALCNAADFDPAAVREDLDNAEAVLVLAERAKELIQRLADSRLRWLAEAYEPSLTLYRMAKVRAERDGDLRLVLAPMEEVFAENREGGKKRTKDRTVVETDVTG